MNDIEYNAAISELHYALMSSEINHQPSDISSKHMLKSDLESTSHFLSSAAKAVISMVKKSMNKKLLSDLHHAYNRQGE